jgi:hypothetical protein
LGAELAQAEVPDDREPVQRRIEPGRRQLHLTEHLPDERHQERQPDPTPD